MERSVSIPAKVDLHTLVSNRAAFNALVYTPLDEAMRELKRRREDTDLCRTTEQLLKGDVPAPLARLPHAVTFRQIATPNYESRRFFSLVDAMDDVEPLFLEYAKDKFVSCNEVKHALGKLHFFSGVGKKGGAKISSMTIVDFNAANGRSLSDVATHWEQSLVAFHHEFFDMCFRKNTKAFFDASDWFIRQGANALGYYKAFLLLFIRHGILFEDFLLNAKESGFTKEVFLPAFLSIRETVGVKPLIVDLAPTDIEGKKFWMCYPERDKEFVHEKMYRTEKRS